MRVNFVLPSNFFFSPLFVLPCLYLASAFISLLPLSRFCLYLASAFISLLPLSRLCLYLASAFISLLTKKIVTI